MSLESKYIRTYVVKYDIKCKIIGVPKSYFQNISMAEKIFHHQMNIYQRKKGLKVDLFFRQEIHNYGCKSKRFSSNFCTSYRKTSCERRYKCKIRNSTGPDA